MKTKKLCRHNKGSLHSKIPYHFSTVKVLGLRLVNLARVADKLRGNEVCRDKKTRQGEFIEKYLFAFPT